MPYFFSSGAIFREKPITPVWFFRQNMFFFTGTIAWCLMTLTMCLPLRSSRLNKVPGIGITLFIAQLEYLSQHGASPVPVDLWYCISRGEDAWYVDKLTSLCILAGVTLHLLDAHKGEYLQVQNLTDKIADRCDTHFWFCGPQSFAKALGKGLRENGIANQNFHYDRFCMR